MNNIGEFSLLLALATAIYGVVGYVMAAKGNRVDIYLSAEKTPVIVWFCVTIASIALWKAFLTDDFSLEFVWAYSNKQQETFYKISSFWGGQKGSLLFWTFILSNYMLVAHLQNRSKKSELVPYAMAIMLAIVIFFLCLLNFSTNPFERIPLPPEDGRGLNPLLQNYWMVIHPPTLYLGYVGFTVPFAFAMAALITKNLDDGWIRLTRKWSLVSWFFLCMGNLFGAQWAYVELGWGGYWGWDPVENAAFMPLLVATAFLHSVMIQEKKDMMKVWNMSLILLTFVMTIFGTFITRSGLIQSVHAFDEATLGYIFLGFLAVVITVSVTMILSRLPLLKSKNELDSFLSRESSFLFNNLFLLGIGFATFWGTIFPILSEAVRGIKITVGPPFYNQVNVPIGLALLTLVGIGPVIAWRKASVSNLKKSFIKPLIASGVGAIILFPFAPLHNKSEILTYLAFVICIFVMSTIFIEFFKGTMARMQLHGETFITGLYSLIWRNKRRYGGYIVHLGVVLIFAGIAGSSSYSTETQKHLKVGESIEIRDYTLAYKGLKAVEASDIKTRIIADFVATKDKQYIWTARPEKKFYKGQKQPTSEISLYSTWKEDLYVVLADFQEDESVTVKVHVNPMVSWLWYGQWIIAFGTVICMWPDRQEQRRSLERIRQQNSAFASSREV